MENKGLRLVHVGENFKDMDRIEEINVEAFPEEERIPIKELLEIERVGLGCIDAIYDGEKLIGFAIRGYTEKLHCLLYFAIDKKFRGMGYGTKVHNLFKEYEKENPNKRIYMLEVESLDPKSDNYKQRQSRVKFYNRLGYHMTGIRYIQNGADFTIMTDSYELNDEELEKEFDKIGDWWDEFTGQECHDVK